ncbi:surface-adhesin E family protein [Orbus mooreae]|uniref:surface-adhesin E family protein n=1 Tax=Orbus mooreae TaxID=3074107 RepID=UPI00370D3625
MKKRHYITHFISGLSLLVCSYSVFSLDTDTPPTTNVGLSDSQVPAQYLPIEKSNIGNYTSYTFIDKSSVKLHPYNHLIRTYTRVTNFGSEQFLQYESKNKTPYRSVVSQEYVNCDLREYAKGLVENYESYFGKGKLINIDHSPKRWETTDLDDRERQNLIVICSLPINN